MTETELPWESYLVLKKAFVAYTHERMDKKNNNNPYLEEFTYAIPPSKVEPFFNTLLPVKIINP